MRETFAQAVKKNVNENRSIYSYTQWILYLGKKKKRKEKKKLPKKKSFVL